MAIFNRSLPEGMGYMKFMEDHSSYGISPQWVDAFLKTNSLLLGDPPTVGCLVGKMNQFNLQGYMMIHLPSGYLT